MEAMHLIFVFDLVTDGVNWPSCDCQWEIGPSRGNTGSGNWFGKVRQMGGAMVKRKITLTGL